MDPQMDNVFIMKTVKKDGKLVPINGGHAALYKEFVNSLQEGQEIEIMHEAYKDDGTNLQLARIHVCLRKLAQEIGYTFEEMKLEIKKKAGLVCGSHVKSLADCSKEELGLVIEALNEAGSMVNIIF